MMAEMKVTAATPQNLKLNGVNDYLVDWQIIVTFVGFLAVLGSE